MFSFQGFIGYSLFEALTIPLYLRILYVLVRRPIFWSPFYRFLLVIGFANFANYIAVELFLLLPLYFVSVSQFVAQLPASRWLSCVQLISFASSYQQDFLHICISLNRFTGVCRPFDHQKFWKRWWLRLLILSFLCSYPLMAHELFSVSQFLPVDPNEPMSKGYVLIPIKYDLYYVNNFLMTTVLNSICLVLCVLLNGLSLRRLFQLRASNKAKIEVTQLQRIQQQQQHKNSIEIRRTTSSNAAAAAHSSSSTSAAAGIQKVEFNLLAVALVMTTMLVVSMLHQFSFFFAQTFLDGADEINVLYWLMQQMPWVNDLRDLSQPWVLLIVCEDVRNEALPWLKQWRKIWRKLWKKSEQLGNNNNKVTTVQPSTSQPAMFGHI